MSLVWWPFTDILLFNTPSVILLPRQSDRAMHVFPIQGSMHRTTGEGLNFLSHLYPAIATFPQQQIHYSIRVWNTINSKVHYSPMHNTGNNEGTLNTNWLQSRRQCDGSGETDTKDRYCIPKWWLKKPPSGQLGMEYKIMVKDHGLGPMRPFNT